MTLILQAQFFMSLKNFTVVTSAFVIKMFVWVFVNNIGIEYMAIENNTEAHRCH